MADFETHPRGTVDGLRAENERLRDALRDLIDYAESAEVQIEGEWGYCRNLDEMEADNDLAEEIVAAREALK